MFVATTVQLLKTEMNNILESPPILPKSFAARVPISNTGSNLKHMAEPRTVRVALLTGGDDKSYAVGLTAALITKNVELDFIGSNNLDEPWLHEASLVHFLNLRGDQRENAGFITKVIRIAVYYGRLIQYAAVARPHIFHILWNNKFEFFDRVVLMLYYRSLGKKVILTAHNVNMQRRDNCDSWWNRISLRAQYGLAHHIFVHTDRMKRELTADFCVPRSKVTVIPFGINNTSPVTTITVHEARQHLGIGCDHKTVLFFGQIAPYKGLEYLIDAFAKLTKRDDTYRLVIAGKVKKGHADYWKKVHDAISLRGLQDHVIERIEHIPETDLELYFKAADVLIVPYTNISQSGVPFLGYSFGLPVIATDTGSLREDVIDGKTGLICRPRDVSDLAQAICRYFDSELFRDLEARREEIKRYANDRYSWRKVAEITRQVYDELNTWE